ncbi:MAG TPA: PQQ-binding-like beta-propeller repeat protein [Planctomycetota bacterium]|nr:PQQ-binding-like beta-propeller repeat protein [Planctomycetota bacterium]HRR81774.1 PQQ-binding-like beta-propeller repeat protein [Planctomycetota bacterium]HRT95339.1 PQQ-binding-like beta-propeller repeat protein [Planctomycetota bacterium]
MAKARLSLIHLFLAGVWLAALSRPAEAVVPVLVGPLQALLAILPSLLIALGGMLLAFFRPSFYKKLAIFLWNQKVFSLCLLAVAAGLVFLSRVGWGTSGPAASEMRAGSDWPVFRGGPERRGAVLDAPEPTLPETIWSFKSDAKCIYASPAIVGNRLYVTTAEKGVFTDRGAILCLDAETGGEVWRYSPRDFRATFSSPSVVVGGTSPSRVSRRGDTPPTGDGYVVVGEGLHYTTDARINCLDLKGNLVWELRTKSHVESAPCIYNGRVYIGAGDDGYYCIDLAPGPDGKPNVVWHLDGKKYPDCETAHLVADGMVFLGLGMGGNAILGLDAETGKELWRLEAPYPVFAPPALADGKLYVGMGNGNYVETAEQVRDNVLKKMRDAGKSAAELTEAEKRLGPAGEVWCIEPKTGKVLWKFPTPQVILGAIVVGGGSGTVGGTSPSRDTVGGTSASRESRGTEAPPTMSDRIYFGARDGQFYCLSTAGKLIKSWHAHEPILASPAVGGEFAYVVTNSGRLHCLKADTLEPVWDTSLGQGANFISSPTLALGHIYVGTEQDGLKCIGRRGEKLPPLWTGMERGGSDGSSLPERGQLLWRYPKETNDKFAVTAPIVPWGDGLAVPCTLDGKAMLLKLKLGRGIEDEQRVVMKTEYDKPVSVTSTASLGEMAAIVFGNRYLARNRTYYDHRGKSLHFYPLRNTSGGCALDRRHAYVWCDALVLACLSLTGSSDPPRNTPAPQDDRDGRLPSVWYAEVGPGGLPPAPGEGILTVATNTELLALDDSTGTVLWRVPLKETPLFGPVRLPKGIVLATPKGIAVHKIVDGSVAWTVDCGPLAAPLNADADRIAAITKAGELLVLASSDGKQLAKVSDVAGRVPPLLLGDKVLFVNKDLTLLREGEDVPVQWARTAWLGNVVTPLVLLDGCVYFATETKGVVCVGALKR